NSVVAFVGASGMGKSTLAAALCEAGYALVADDLLRVASTGNGVMLAYPGSTESRLRKTARGLADAAPDDHVHTTADGRLALRSRTTSVGPLPLAVCVIPRPCQAAVEVSVNRLRPARGLARLMQFPRVVGWSESQSMGATFQSLADLVEQVPVFEATIPWGPPFQPEVLTGLLEAVMVDRSVSS
ncbi:MAG: AAA family ATPase, partial [Sciscionella sp.]